ncbi:MAG: TauD/TfdA family dioxygenase [Myxococcota bacterium]|nr:TauD/TfdA family dioxygenase [Myxococcota bacterium]
MALGNKEAPTSEYNRIAMDTAQKFHAIRKAGVEKNRGAERPREKLFPAFDRAGLGIVLEYERMGNRPVSEALERAFETLGYSLEHLGLTIGTIVRGIDLRAIGTDEAELLRKLLLERKVIFFHDQHLEEDEQVTLARHFGELDAFPFGGSGQNPYVLEIRHGRHSPGIENGWHTDVTWMERPSLGSIAQCIQAPPFGGDTLFSDSHACYLGLTTELRDAIEHLEGIHDYRNFLTQRAPGSLPEDLLKQIQEEIPFGVSHPLVRTHPETGQRGLYIHGGFLRHESLTDRRSGETLDAKQSRNLVRELLQQHARPEYTCRFRWGVGSIAFWDNRAAQHYAVSDYFPHQRVLRRVTVSGDRPFLRPIEAE